MITTIHDYYGPSILTTHDEAEVEGWLRTAGLDDIQTLPVPVSMIGRSRPKPPSDKVVRERSHA